MGLRARPLCGDRKGRRRWGQKEGTKPGQRDKGKRRRSTWQHLWDFHRSPHLWTTACSVWWDHYYLLFTGMLFLPSHLSHSQGILTRTHKHRLIKVTYYTGRRRQVLSYHLSSLCATPRNSQLQVWGLIISVIVQMVFIIDHATGKSLW